LTNMGQVYVETALDAANDQALSQETAKTEPDMAYLPFIQPAITITNLMSRFISMVLIRLAESNTTVKREMDKQTSLAINRMEEKTNLTIQHTIDVVLNWVTKLLAGQKKTDFRPKDTDLSYLENLATSTCLSICTFLGRFFNLAQQAISGQNLTALTTEVAVGVRDLLFIHFQKWQVNATGGLMVGKDMSKYVGTLKEWPLRTEIEKNLEVLSEIGNMFIIGPEALRERGRLLVQGQIAGKGLEKTDFKAFVLRRDDSGSVGIQSVLAGL